MLRTALVLALLSSTAIAQSKQDPPQWKALQQLVGTWSGTGEGQPGRSIVSRTYELILNSRFLLGKNRSVYTPQEKNPKGETHENWDILSWDRTRKTCVLRQLHVESFVNQYILDSVSSDLRFFRFVTEAIENIPAGWKARETYEFLNMKEFIESFELAEPGKEFILYTKNHFKRN